ncbi:MAG: hypothetical protein Q7R41_07280 [Phycisphaerales bacterium]|nr:hypothetical protein [Phycisphaerales bacterium]
MNHPGIHIALFHESNDDITRWGEVRLVGCHAPSPNTGCRAAWMSLIAFTAVIVWAALVVGLFATALIVGKFTFLE